MRAVTLEPGKPGSLRLDELPQTARAQGELLVRALAVGICGTDSDLVEGRHGASPPGETRLVIGHESLGVVVEAPHGSGFAEGDLAVGIVRHPDPLPCGHCAIGEWDMCSNGRYTERGIKRAHGFAAESFCVEPAMAVKVDPALGLCAVLLEPASVVAKAWEHIEHIGRRARWAPQRLLVTGAGPVGLLAALMGVQRGLEVHVLDRNTEGPKPALVKALNASHSPGLPEGVFDIVIEATGAPAVIGDVLRGSQPNQIVCLTGLSAAAAGSALDAAAFNQALVTGNRVVFGTVNANRRHYDAAARALARADRPWLERMITRKVPIARWREAYEDVPGDVKTVLAFDMPA
jgi:glucose 1-dehydrogenase